MEVESTPPATPQIKHSAKGDASQASPKSKGSSLRLLVLVILGVIAIGGGLAVRSSTWARERRLKHLDVNELKLASLDSPNDPLVLTYYGSALMTDNRVAESAKAFEQASRLDPKSARAHMGLASALFRMGVLKEATDAFEETVKLDPNLPDAYLGLAQAYYARGSAKRAIDPLKKLTEIQPTNSIAWFTLGQIYGDAHESDLALDALMKATQLDPSKPDYWRSLGRVSQHYSKLADAEQQYIKCLKLNENDAIAYLWLGQVYMQMGDTPEYRGKAEASITRAVSRQPDMSEGYFALGQLYERRSMWDFAVNNYRKAHDYNPSDDQALYHLGLSMVKQGNAAEGNKLIKAAEELGTVGRDIKNLENRIIADPQNRDLRLTLVRIYRKYGNDDGAAQRYKEYMNMGPAVPGMDKEINSFRQEYDRHQKEAAAKAAKAQQSAAAQQGGISQDGVAPPNPPIPPNTGIKPKP